MRWCNILKQISVGYPQIRFLTTIRPWHHCFIDIRATQFLRHCKPETWNSVASPVWWWIPSWTNNVCLPESKQEHGVKSRVDEITRYNSRQLKTSFYHQIGRATGLLVVPVQRHLMPAQPPDKWGLYHSNNAAWRNLMKKFSTSTHWVRY